MDHLSAAAHGTALALTATAGTLAAGLPFSGGGVLVLLSSVLVAARWAGRTAGYAAVLSGGGFALLLHVGGGAAPPSGLDALALILFGLIGCGLAAWTAPRGLRPADPPADSRRAKEDFLATVSHELRTPLNAILGWTAVLRTRRSGAPPQVERGLEVIERNARRQLALVEELIAAAEPETSPDDWQRLDVREMLDTLRQGLEPMARREGIALAADEPIGAAGDGIWVRGDAASLRLAIRHVLDNAIKYTPVGGEVRTRLRQCGGQVLIFVSDTGGIESEDVERLFEPFHQLDGSASRRFGGLGLGLTIARKLIERHGGHVDLRSEGPVGGATVLITLPQAGGSAG
jgi:signal transduction histidine kinase